MWEDSVGCGVGGMVLVIVRGGEDGVVYDKGRRMVLIVIEIGEC